MSFFQVKVLNMGRHLKIAEDCFLINNIIDKILSFTGGKPVDGNFADCGGNTSKLSACRQHSV